MGNVVDTDGEIGKECLLGRHIGIYKQAFSKNMNLVFLSCVGF